MKRKMRVPVGKCTVYKLFGLCMVLVLVSLLWLQLSCSGEMSSMLRTDTSPSSISHPAPPRARHLRQRPVLGSSQTGLVSPSESASRSAGVRPLHAHVLNKKKIRHKIIVINQGITTGRAAPTTTEEEITL
ncbi:hypothetical protein INR49_023170 [Caranx melampygus]|nr:hypothetical protein INR49_023170 [Caranx melampygus]